MAILHRVYKVSMVQLERLVARYEGVPSEEQCWAFLKAGGLLQRDLMNDLAIDVDSDWDDEESRLVLLGMASSRMCGLSERLSSGWHVLDSGFPTGPDGLPALHLTLRGDHASAVPGLTDLVGDVRRARFVSHGQATSQLSVLDAADTDDVLRRLSIGSHQDALFERAASAFDAPDPTRFVAGILDDARHLLQAVTPEDFLMVFLD